MTINQAWHDSNRFPKHPTTSERVNWYAQHMRHCGCSLGPSALERELKRQAGIVDDTPSDDTTTPLK